MKLTPLGKNLSVLTIGEQTSFHTEILFSYETPVAARTPAGDFRTEKKWSVTTSRHIGKWLGRAGVERPQKFFDDLANGGI